MVYCISRGWEMAKSDVSTAFLQAPMTDEVWVTLPQNTPPAYTPGATAKALKAVYGLKDAPRVYTQYFKQEVKALGWIEIHESVFVLSQPHSMLLIGVMIMHVDDLLVVAENPCHILDNQIGKLFDIEKAELLTQENAFTYIGMVLRKEQNGLKMDQSEYLHNITPSLTPKEAKHKLTENDVSSPPDINSITLTHVQEMQSSLGILGWAAQTQPSLAYAFGELSRWATKPTTQKLKAMQQALYYAKHHSQPLTFMSITKPLLRVWSDASFRRSTLDTRLGYEAQLLDAITHKWNTHDTTKFTQTNLIGWKSSLFKRKVASTTTAELCALMAAVKQSFLYKSVVEKIWNCECEVEFIVDCDPLYQQLQSKRSKAEPSFQGELDYVVQEIARLKARVYWTDTHTMQADRLTKLQLFYTHTHIEHV
eukprot:GHVR01037970.1.p1 GENE.GHVR01037970.1~~GHVR01037970.1.p1  ORF type:complete len:423 (+),score=64.78 GHVR01037970.1:769-2037(+)